MISDPDDLWRHQPEPPAVDLDAVFLLPGDCDCGHEEIQHEHGGRCEACGDATPCYEYDPDGLGAP